MPSHSQGMLGIINHELRTRLQGIASYVGLFQATVDVHRHLYES